MSTTESDTNAKHKPVVQMMANLQFPEATETQVGDISDRERIE